jgi:hypothetical protein
LLEHKLVPAAPIAPAAAVLEGGAGAGGGLAAIVEIRTV